MVGISDNLGHDLQQMHFLHFKMKYYHRELIWKVDI